MIAKFECDVLLLCVRSRRPRLVPCDSIGTGESGLVQPRQCLFSHLPDGSHDSQRELPSYSCLGHFVSQSRSPACDSACTSSLCNIEAYR